MKIAVASGKGGTGKTTLSVALALTAKSPITLLDCDVEEPNCHLFFKGETLTEKDVNQLIPQVNPNKCISCGKCAKFCQFNAIITIKDSPAMVFGEMCHACGGCAAICPEGAIEEVPFKIGTLTNENIEKDKNLITGRLDIGLAMAPPVIKEVLRQVENKQNNEIVIIDSPPGTSCPFVTAAKGSDFVIFVTEPTPFGLNDLKIAIETIRDIGTPYAVVINRSENIKNIITNYCKDEKIDVLLQIENSRDVAEVYSRGGTILDAKPELKEKIAKLLKDVEARVVL